MGAAQRNYYGKALARLAKERDDVVVLDADLAGSTKTSEFKKVAPERFVEVGIAEQDMIGVASGLAASGKTVFASTFAVFATGRCWEQIRLAVAYPKQNVKIVSTHCGISVGEDGASHQAYAATMAIAEERGPCYMRLGRADFPLIYPEDVKFEIGKADILREGSDVTLIGTGQMVSYCLDAAKALSEEGISAEVINISTIKPLDADAVIGSVKKTGCAVTAEEHSIIGGLGSAVAEAISESCPVPLVRVGTKDTFGESGKAEMLMEKYGLTAKDIVKAAKDSISKKR